MELRALKNSNSLVFNRFPIYNGLARWNVACSVSGIRKVEHRSVEQVYSLF